MYQQYFHFSELPFSIAPDPHFMFMSARHQEGLAHLLYGINMGGGFVALTGEVGTGKTTLCRCLLQQLPANVDIALILNPKLNAVELLATICDELSIGYDKNRQTLKDFIDKINQYLLTAYANGRRTVLLIDEAQNLSLEVLEQVRLLTNLETSKTKLLQIILVGQPELKQLLSQKDLRQLNQRITARYHLLPLSLDETRAYIHHRLAVCNGNPDLFKDRAVRKIYQFSSGIPRLINILCDRALLGAYATNAHAITPDIIARAAQETLALESPHRQAKKAAIALALFSSIAAGIYFFSQHQPADHQVKLVLSGQSPAPASKPAIKSPQPAPKPEPVAPKAEMKTFNAWLEDPALSLNSAMIQALKAWKKAVPTDNRADCHYMETVGLRCLFDKANWKDILELDRPAILEFSLANEQKRYALLTGVHKGQPVIRFNDDLTFPLADVLSLWDGYYLMLWQPPRPDMADIVPQHTSANVLWLRQQLSTVTGTRTSVNEPMFFDEALKKQVIDFQRLHHLTADGIAGARTLIHLDNSIGAKDSPHLEIMD
ncbi:AAA family ATPase [Methylobacter sp. Wu1]|uniref:ExeA family protein n=1 Tax=Methylobacter sp. Wu1 TaxID=3119359 RepID=UPI002F939F03